MSIASWTSPPASARTLPISRVISSVSSSLRSTNALRDAEEDLGALRAPGTSRQLSQASFAAATARSTSSAVEQREDADQLAGRRVVRLERLAAGGVDPLAADVVLVGLRARRRHRSPFVVGERFY